MDLVGYVRVGIDGALSDVRSRDDQERVLHAWARANGHRITEVVVDEGRHSGTPVAERAALADALDAIRERRAGGLVVVRLDRLSPEVVTQEQLRAEIARTGGRLLSTEPADAGSLADPSPDRDRQLIRDTLASVPAFAAAMRDLRVRNRMRNARVPLDVEAASLSRIDEMAEHGATDGDIRAALAAGRHRLVRLMRLLRRA